MSVIKNISSLFFLTLLLVSMYLVYLVFKPYWVSIFIASVIVVAAYPLYEKLLVFTKGKSHLAAGLACLIITLVVIVPLVMFLFYLSTYSIGAFEKVSNWVLTGTGREQVNDYVRIIFEKTGITWTEVSVFITNSLGSINQVLINGLADFVKGTTQLFADLFFIVATMFFLFKDGKLLLQKIMKLTPLQDQDDKALFDQFREISYNGVVSTLIVGVIQAVMAAIAFGIVGVPALLLGFATLFASFIPFVGTALVLIPVIIFLLISGQYGSALFIFIWGMGVIGTIDNILRPYLMKGKTHIHPMILFFSIFGGITLFGFWGIVFGPLIVAVSMTLLNMYEVQYTHVLYGENGINKNK